jgi:CubicO group peptidase (beta-lactamase class C family)
LLTLSLVYNPVFADKATNRALTTDLNQYIHSLQQRDEFSGVVLIAEDAKPIYEFASGDASKRYHTPINMQTKFNTASMGEMFTSIAILQLVEQGKIDLNTPIIHYLPDYPNKKVAQQITVAQLLSHTSGLGDVFTAEFTNGSKEKYRDYKNFFPLVVHQPLSFKPGAKFQYSNAGFVVLGAIIEKVSGESYYDYINKHVFEPAGMKNTGYYDLVDERVTNLATGYTYAGTDGSYRRNNTDLIPVKGFPAGGLYTTAEDMLQFSKALQTHTLVGKQYTDMAFKPKSSTFLPGNSKIGYGYGFIVDNTYDTPIIGHAGGIFGVADNFQIFLDKDYTVIVLMNYDNPQAMVISARADSIISGKELPKAISLSAQQMDAVVGNYHITTKDVPIKNVTIQKQNNTLQVKMEWNIPKGDVSLNRPMLWQPLTPITADTFYLDGDFNNIITVKNNTIVLQNKMVPAMKMLGKKVS